MQKEEHAYTKVIYLIAFIMFILSFFYEKTVFTVGRLDNIFAYTVLKILQLGLYIVAAFFFTKIIERDGFERKLLLFTLPNFVILIVNYYLHCSLLHINGLSGDELNIFNKVIEFNLFPYHFGFYTGVVYAISLMIIPKWYGIIIIKLFVQALICGYALYRANNYYKNIFCVIILELLFCSNIFITSSYSIHRMYWYALLYFLFIIKMLFDYMEKKNAEMKDMVFIFVSGGVLSVWRREGIYLLILAFFFFFIAYHIGMKKIQKREIVLYLIIMLCIWGPDIYSTLVKNVAANETLHTYNAIITHMRREGLNWNEYPEEKKCIEKVVSLETIDRLNEDFGDENYADEWIAFRKGYEGIKEGVSLQEVENYKKSIRRLIIKEPFIFLKTRFGSWNYSALKRIEDKDNPIKMIFESLYMPLILILFVFLVGICKRKMLYIMISLCMYIHTGITTLLTPAGYYKYYLHMYYIGMFIGAIVLFNCLTYIQNGIVNANGE